jgi:putative hydrolase of the HAD superfamily
MTRTVFLDAGGVLVNPNWARVRDLLARHGLETEARRLEDADHRVKHELDCAVEPSSLASRDIEQEFFERVLEWVGLTVDDRARAAIADIRAYHAAHNLWDIVHDEVPAALAALRASGLRLVVVSNSNGTLKRTLDRLGLSTAFDVVIDSTEEGAFKPDPRLFEIALGRSGSDRRTTLHLGDVYQTDVRGAESAGIRPVLLDRLDLYRTHACRRVRSLAEFASHVPLGTFDL